MLVLPFFSKVFKRVMYVKLFSVINLLYKYEFGFRQGSGTDIALVFLIDKILGSMLFLMYINDLSKVSSLFFFTLR